MLGQLETHMQFQDVFREERYYCNHFFRLLCEKLNETPKSSGLARVLAQLGITLPSEPEIQGAEIYTEVAAFRDVYERVTNKETFLEDLYDQLLPIMQIQYKGLISQPIRPTELRVRIGNVHPSKYKDMVDEPDFERQDALFYREIGALFNAKPDYLILIPNYSIWIEAKYKSAFSISQITRMRNIGSICNSKLFGEFFSGHEPLIVLLGSNSRHLNAKKIENTKFLSWEQCSEIAAKVFTSGAADITSRALATISA